MEGSGDGRLTVPWISRIAKPVGVSSKGGSGFEGGTMGALGIKWRGMVGIAWDWVCGIACKRRMQERVHAEKKAGTSVVRLALQILLEDHFLF